MSGYGCVFNTAALRIYLGFFSVLIASGLGMPIPEELPIVAAGAMVGHAASGEQNDPRITSRVATLAASPVLPFPAALPWQALTQSVEYSVNPPPIQPIPVRWWIMLPVCICGVVIGDSFLYGLGRYFGPRLFERPWAKRMVPTKRRESMEENFRRYGVLVLLFARMVPTVRAPIFVMAGVLRVTFARFVLADGLYAIPGVSLLFGLAFWFGDAFRDLVSQQIVRVEKARPLLILISIAGVAAYLFYHFLRHPLATGDPREELPMIGTRVAEKLEGSQDDSKAEMNLPPVTDTTNGGQAPAENKTDADGNVNGKPPGKSNSTSNESDSKSK
jgi:membrane protein DedA with SNARE-associated domain